MSANLKLDKNRRIAEPIRRIEDINRIRSNLIYNPRDLLLFDLATQTGIGMKNLLLLKVSDLMGVKVGSNMPIKTNKYEKHNIIMTQILYESFHNYLEELRPKPDDYLFKPKKCNRPLNLSTVSNMINKWFSAADINNCYGVASLRKTWEYNQKDKTNLDQDITLSDMTSILFKPIVMPKAQNTIYKDLLNAIVSGRIPPGTRFTAAEIAKAFNVSQAPVRVALNWLEAKGFIVSQKKKGSIVKKLSSAEFNEILKIRLMLESEAAKISYNIRTEETLNLLESLNERAAKENNFEKLDKIFKQFHLTLYRDANMPILIDMLSDLCNKMSPYAIIDTLKLIKMSDDKEIHLRKVHHYYSIKLIEGMRNRNINQILEYLEKKLSYHGSFITEERFGDRKTPLL